MIPAANQVSRATPDVRSASPDIAARKSIIGTQKSFNAASAKDVAVAGAPESSAASRANLKNDSTKDNITKRSNVSIPPDKDSTGIQAPLELVTDYSSTLK